MLSVGAAFAPGAATAPPAVPFTYARANVGLTQILALLNIAETKSHSEHVAPSSAGAGPRGVRNVLYLSAARTAPPHAPGRVHRAGHRARDRPGDHGDGGRLGRQERPGHRAARAVRRGYGRHRDQDAGRRIG